MKKTRKKLTLNRDTLCSLTTPALSQAAGDGTGTRTCTLVVTCGCTISCLTCTCPTRCGQWYC